MPGKSNPRTASATFARSYLVTLGLAFNAFAVFIWYSWLSDGAPDLTWPKYAVLFAFPPGGISLTLLGLFGASSKMEGWAEVTSRHEASIIVMILTYPVYLVLKVFHDHEQR